MKKTVKLLGACAAGLALIIGASIITNTYKVTSGIRFTLKEESMEGQLNELSKVLLEKADVNEDAMLTEIDIDWYKDMPELFMTGMLYNEEKQETVSWNYFKSESSGHIFTSPEEGESTPNAVRWSDFLDAIHAADIDGLVNVGGDHVSILCMDGPVEFDEEERQETYTYDKLKIREDADGNIRKLGYYLYKDGSCTPVAKMEKMTGSYYVIYISYSKKERDESYGGVARLGILLEA